MFVLFLASLMLQRSFKFTYILILVILMPACGSQNHKYTSGKRIVPKNRNRYYNPKKDKHKSRTKKVKALM